MTKEGSTKIIKFITIRVFRYSVAICHYRYSEYALSSNLSIYIPLIAIELSKYDAAFLCHCLFFIYYMIGQLICNC